MVAWDRWEWVALKSLVNHHVPSSISIICYCYGGTHMFRQSQVGIFTSERTNVFARSLRFAIDLGALVRHEDWHSVLKGFKPLALCIFPQKNMTPDENDCDALVAYYHTRRFKHQRLQNIMYIDILGLLAFPTWPCELLILFIIIISVYHYY
jgi:hypothetical protein